MREMSLYIFTASFVGMVLSVFPAIVYMYIMSRNECELMITDKKLHSKYQKRVKTIMKISLFFTGLMVVTVLDTLFIYGDKEGLLKYCGF